MTAELTRAQLPSLLSDGTPVASLVDVERRRLAMRVHSDVEVHDLELKKIFAKAWMVVAHASEIPNSGDFVHRYIGDDPVVVARGRDGQVRVMLNACTHRGSMVCRADSGNATNFRCAFHGWTFDTSGKLTGVPLERGLYGKLERDGLGLIQARVEVLFGLVFACWDSDTPPLADYLGDFTDYLAAVFKRTDKGLVAAGPPQRWVLSGNWKLPAEQHVGDFYHAYSTHLSLKTTMGLAMGGNQLPTGAGASVNGHGTQLVDILMGAGENMGKTAREALKSSGALADSMPIPPNGMPVELIDQMPNNLNDAQIELIVRASPTVGTIFPSSSWLNVPSGDGNGGYGPVLCLRMWVPRGPDRTELYNLPLVEADASPEYKEAARRCTQFNFGPGGLFEMDDGDQWANTQKAIRGVIAKERLFGDYRALEEPHVSEGFPMKGRIWEGDGIGRDSLNWHFYLRWQEFMDDRAW